MKVVLIKYNGGNYTSVLCALARLGIQGLVSGEPEVISSADKVIFPGVGEASSTMDYLRINKLDKVVKSLTQPTLGICLGMQVLCTKSEENNVECLKIFPEQVKRFTIPRKIPHMGWNKVVNTTTGLFDNIPEESYFYFVHSFYAEIGECSIAKGEYEEVFATALMKDNFYAVQFHPEKSGDVGSKLIENFLNFK
jgi:imidazole glycerol-phosphate synthase subunit HisH